MLEPKLERAEEICSSSTDVKHQIILVIAYLVLCTIYQRFSFFVTVEFLP